MTTPYSPKRKSHHSSAPGAKVLITAASIAAVLGGWAGLTIQHNQGGGSLQVTNATFPGEVLTNLPPLPTLIPQPSGLTVNSTQVLAQNSTLLNNSQPFPALRAVQAPPQPLAITRSSR